MKKHIQTSVHWGGSFSDINLHFVAAKETGLKTIEELIELIKKKKSVKIGVGSAGTTDYLFLSELLAYYSLSFDDIEKNSGKVYFGGYVDLVNLFKDRHIDYAFLNIATPASCLIEASAARKIMLLSFSPELTEYFHNKFGCYSKDDEKSMIKAGTYSGTDEDILSPGMGTEITVNKKLPEDVAYKITKIICENTDYLPIIHITMKAFIPEKGWKYVALPLHPGAERYYKEMGYLK